MLRGDVAQYVAWTKGDVEEEMDFNNCFTLVPSLNVFWPYLPHAETSDQKCLDGPLCCCPLKWQYVMHGTEGKTPGPALLKIHAYVGREKWAYSRDEYFLINTGSFYLLPNLYFLCFSEISSALLVLSSITRRMLSVVVFCFISVGDGSFQEEAAEEGDNVKSKKAAGHQLRVTWRYVTV